MALDTRKWGIDLIGGMYVIASSLTLATFRDPNPIVMWFAMPTAIVLLPLGLGLVARFGPARTATVAVLWIFLGLAVLLLIAKIAQVAGWLPAAPGLDADRAVIKEIGRLSITWMILSYLRSPEVEDEFT